EPREPLAHEHPDGEIPAVHDRQAEPAARHRVRGGRPVGVERDLDARHAGNPTELVDGAGVDRPPHAVSAEQDHAEPDAVWAGGVLPAPARIEADDALEPARTVEIDPLIGEAEVRLDDRAADGLEVHEPGIAREVP